MVENTHLWPKASLEVESSLRLLVLTSARTPLFIASKPATVVRGPRAPAN